MITAGKRYQDGRLTVGLVMRPLQHDGRQVDNALVTHLPGEVNLCGLSPSVASWLLALIGLANIVGSLIAGASTARFRSKHILAVMYGSRVLLIGWYLLAPKSEWTFYAFAVGLGLTWLATVPPTAAIVGKLFGIRYLATLFGFTLLSHQVGGFLGAYLGGIAITHFGDYRWMWYADMAPAAAAAMINLPIREARVVPSPATAARLLRPNRAAGQPLNLRWSMLSLRSQHLP